MPDSSPRKDDPYRDLQARADALETSTRRNPAASIAGSRAADQGYRIVADLLGGVIVGLALGFGVQLIGFPAPWGLIGGVLLGFAVSIWMAKRTADRLMAQARAENAAQTQPAPSIPFDDEDED